MFYKKKSYSYHLFLSQLNDNNYLSPININLILPKYVYYVMKTGTYQDLL